MDPTGYYAQAGPSSQHTQDNDRANRMQVAPLDTQAVQRYIHDLYQNPASVKSGPTNDPVFYAKAQKDLLGVKHRLEQMLLINQQHAERAQMAAQIPYTPSSHPPHAAYMNPQGGPPYLHGAWTGSASGPWMHQQPTHAPQPVFQQPVYPPQAYSQPVTRVYTGQHMPDVMMHDATYPQVQSVPQVAQIDSPQPYSIPPRPSQSRSQTQTGTTSENSQPAQQPGLLLPNVPAPTQSQPASSASTSHVQNVHQTQPQPQRPAPSQNQQPTMSQRNPLQPGHQPNQTNPLAAQKDRESAQKQLQYLQLLAQQHQRTQQTRASHTNSPNLSQTALPSAASVPNTSGSDGAFPQLVPRLGPIQRSSSPQQEPPAPVAKLESVDPVTPSPAKIRSRKPFALHDLRSGRKQSTAPSNGSSTPSRETHPPNDEGVNTPIVERVSIFTQPSSNMLIQVTAATPTKDAKPVNNTNHCSIAEPGSSQKPPTQKPASSPNPSNMPSVLAQTVRIAAESAGTTSLASEIPNASTPALNNHAAQPTAVPASSTSAQKQSGGGGSKMKIALENLHARGVDCVALVRQAAFIANLSVSNLPQTSPVDPSIPLFAPRQPLDVWTSNLQVTRGQGDAVIKNIWDLMKRKAREIGIDADLLKHPAPETTNETPAENDRVAKYGNSIPPVDSLPVTSSSNDSAGHGASQHVTATQQPQVTPNVANLNLEPRLQSTQPPMETQAIPPQPAPAPIPAHPAPAPVAPPEVVQPMPTRQTPVAPSSGHFDPAIWQAQLAQRHQYNPYSNGAPLPQPGYRAPEQQPPAYVPPNLSTHTQIPAQVPLSQAPVHAVQSQPQSQPQPVRTKPRKTAALDYLRMLGVITVDVEPPQVPDYVPSEPAVVESATIQTKDKGKGKATDLVEPAAPAPEPSNNESAVPGPAPEPTPPVNVAGPSQVLEMPPSPIAPTIAVLPEPSPTPPSPLSMAEDITRPMTPIAHSPVVIHSPTLVQPSTTIVDVSDVPVPTQPPAPNSISAEAPPSPIAPTSNADSAPPVVSQETEILSPPIASISTLALNNQSSTPLKRKRESRPPDVIEAEAGPGPNTEARARQEHTVTKHDQKRPKVTKRDLTTTGPSRKSSYSESPYPNIPRPDSPLPNNSWAQSYATAMNLANRAERPLFRPETPSSSPPPKFKIKSEPKPAKRRMIMEVVIPLRKKGKVKADLTSDTGTERDEDLGLRLDELVHDIHDDTKGEQEPDLKMIRRRLRPHVCEWIGCIAVGIQTRAITCAVGQIACFSSRTHDGYGAIFQRNTFGTPCTVLTKASCERTTSERYRMVVHVNRAHREESESELRVFAQPEDFPLGREDPEEGVVLRPDAFPEGVPYFRIMGMALRYEIVPAQISSQRHARIGPIVLRNISAPTGFVSVPRQTSNRAPELPPVLASPMNARPQVRLGTVPPDALGGEMEREARPPSNKSPVRRIATVKGNRVAESSGKARANPSPARSHITITSDESPPEPKTRRISTIQERGQGRGDLGRGDRSMISQSSQSSVPSKTPRYQLVVELPSRGKGGSSPSK